MKILWFCVFIHTVFAELSFGSPYLKNSKLCHQWSCINTKLGLPDTLPPRDQYSRVLRSLLPPGAWREVEEKVLDACYGEKSRRYTNTCPGQAMLHCVVDNLIQNCPEESLRKDDACAPLWTLAGFKYMFSQSCYDNLEKNLATEKRPPWFLKNYFSSKRCDLPQLYNATAMAECGFDTMVHYYTHSPTRNISPITYYHMRPTPSRETGNDRMITGVSLYDEGSSARPNYHDTVNMVKLPTIAPLDPLDCCDLSEFLQPSWRAECGFHVSWGQSRLDIRNETITPPPTTTAKPATFNDVKVVPLSCEKETCVFSKLNIVSESGVVDKDGFLKLLDNLTSVHPDWTKAKGRVVTNCLSNTITAYKDECEINRVLGCTFDVLAENCPHVKKNDPCRRRKVSKNGTTCQISASKYRPKNRHQFCGIPNLVSHALLSECGLTSLSRLEYAPDAPSTPQPRKYSWWAGKSMCHESTAATKCVLGRMGVLTKYNFMDYFKMKDRLRGLAHGADSSLTDVYLGALAGMVRYREHCSTGRKLLNVLDAMITTCPLSKRKYSLQCNQLFAQINSSSPPMPPTSQLKHDQMWRHYQHVLYPYNIESLTANRVNKPPKHNKKYDFGIMNSLAVPPVQTMNIKPQVMSKKPMVLLPVYLRTYGQGKGSLSISPYRDGVLRSDSYALHNNIAMPYTTPKE